MPPTTTPRTGRRRVFPTVDAVLPDPIGATVLRFRNVDLGWLEDELDPLLVRALDRWPDGDRRWVADDNPDGLQPDNVWDALPKILDAWPMRALPPLLEASLRHRVDDGAHTLDEIRDLDPSVFDSPELVEALMVALAYAFGRDPDEVAAALEAGAPPTRAAATPAARSTGSGSSPSGAPRPTPAASDRT